VNPERHVMQGKWKKVSGTLGSPIASFFFLNKKGVEPAILDRQNFYRVYIKVGLVSPKMLPIIGNQHI
jgi:hypothetical protein